jgi:hypothetical protein
MVGKRLVLLLLLVLWDQVLQCFLLPYCFSIQFHQGSGLVLLPHHLDGSLSGIKVELVILLLVVTSVCLCFGVASFVASGPWKYNFAVSRLPWRSPSTLRFRLLFGLQVSNVRNAILHEDQVSILVGSLLLLPLLDFLVQKVDPFVVLFPHFILDALVLHILEPIHLVLVVRRLSSKITRCLIDLFSYQFIFLSLLPCRYKFQVCFVEDHSLNVAIVGLSDEQTLGIAIFVILNDFIPKT